jgi:hypothetical protein
MGVAELWRHSQKIAHQHLCDTFFWRFWRTQHYCTKCRKYFNADLSDLAPPGSHYTSRVIALAVRLVVEDGLSYRPASWHLWRDHRVFVSFATIQNWVEAGGKKGVLSQILSKRP